MKRLMSLMAVIIIVLTLAAPALAASLGVSPSHIELEVSADGYATAAFQVHYFSGDVKVELVDIPLRVEPALLHVDALDVPEDVELTIYGDDSLGSRVYNGFIKFTGLTGDMIAIAVQVRAQVTNLVEGQPLLEPTPEGTVAQIAAQATESSPSSRSDSGPDGLEGLSLNTVIIVAGGLVFLGLVILSVSLMIRRRNR